MSRRSGSWFLLLAIALFAAPEPSLAGAWVLPKGRLWGKLGVSWFTTEEKFADNRLDTLKHHPDGSPVQPGDRIPFDFQTGGRYSVASVLMEAYYGLLEGIEVRAKLPFHSTEFSNDAGDIEPGQGPGDLRLGVAGRIWHSDYWILSTLLEWKIPTADLPRSIYQQPLGEGQHDLSLWIRAGRSLHPRGWLSGELGYRWRFASEELAIDPGNEWLLTVEGGWKPSPPLALKLEFRGLWGGEWLDTGFDLSRELGRRRLITIAPALLIEIGPRLTIEAGADLALAGEGLPAGVLWRLALMGTAF